MTAAKALVSEWNRMGSQMRFFVGTLAGIPDALMHYRGELLRVIAQMGLGTGVLAVIGGTVAIVGFLAMTTGAIVAVQGYNQFASVGVEALTGFASAFFNTREIQPGTVMVALAATVGAGTTAALGAMRINEEIDALEVIGIRSISYLASTRVLAGVVVAVPLFCVGLMTAYLAARVGTTAIYGQGSGVYDHYFNTFLRPTDVLWSSVEVVVVALMIMLVCTYYGYAAYLNNQSGDIIAATDSLNRLVGKFADQQPVFDRALATIPDALAVLADERDTLVEAAEQLSKFSALTVDSVNKTTANLVTELRQLGPVLESLANSGPALTRSLSLLATFPFPNETFQNFQRGEYANLTAIVDLTLSRIDQGLLTGTRWECHLTQLELQWGRTIGQFPSPCTAGYRGTPGNPLTIAYRWDQGP